jgi:hypothetical protein
VGVICFGNQICRGNVVVGSGADAGAGNATGNVVISDAGGGGNATPSPHLSNKFHQFKLINYYMSVTFFVVVKSIKRC